MEYNRTRRNPRRNCRMPMEEVSSNCGCNHAIKEPCGCNPYEDNENWQVAMAYVPWQVYRETLDLPLALQTGTIFPELNRPFMAAGRCGCV